MESSELPLRGLHLPEPVGWWPLAPGWWVLIVILASLSIILAYRAYRKSQFNAPRKYALQALQQAEAEYLTHRDPVKLGQEVSELLRRGMLAYAPRQEIAGLTGEAWLRWLDSGLPVPYFHTEGGKSLLELPYRNPDSDLADVDVGAMLAAARMRLSTPPGGVR